MKFVKRNPLFFVFLIPVIFDVFGTVIGQPSTYWTTNFRTVDEAVPVFFLLQIHPLVFIIFCLSTWLPITYFLVKKLRQPWNLWATFSLFAGHSYNSVNWLRTIYQHNLHIFSAQNQTSQALGLIPMTVYIFIIGLIAAKSFEVYLRQRKTT